MSMRKDVQDCIRRHSPIAPSQIHAYLPAYGLAQIKSTCYNLLYQNAIGLYDSRDPLESVYEINTKPVRIKRNISPEIDYRERKVETIKHLIKKSGERHKDILISILRDYEHV